MLGAIHKGCYTPRQSGPVIWLFHKAMPRTRMLRSLFGIAFPALLLATPVSQAANTESILPSGLVATAAYRQGAEGRPAALVIHGFLQTRHYLTVSSLFTALSDAGYTVLAPTLSLGIDQRRESLPCEAIHTHTMQDDVEEIRHWVDWLRSRGHQRIVLVGHSYGSLQAIVYAVQEPGVPSEKVIATSLIDVEHVVGHKGSAAQIERARSMVRRGQTDLARFRLSYCDKYVSPPKAFLSYVEWSRDRILKALETTRASVEVILGGNDERMAADWPEQVRKAGAQVFVIENANHFFDAEHEFELHDMILQSMERIERGE